MRRVRGPKGAGYILETFEYARERAVLVILHGRISIMFQARQQAVVYAFCLVYCSEIVNICYKNTGDVDVDVDVDRMEMMQGGVLNHILQIQRGRG